METSLYSEGSLNLSVILPFSSLNFKKKIASLTELVLCLGTGLRGDNCML